MRTADPTTQTPFGRAAWGTVAAVVLLAPVAVYPPAKAMFLLPKSAIFFSGSILLAFLMVVGAARGEFPRPQRSGRVAFAITCAILLWTTLATIFSTNPRLSVGALGAAAAYAIFFVSTLYLLQRRTVRSLWPLFAAAAANAVVVIFQESGTWQPFELQDLSYDPHLASTGLMGNPNGVGMLLMGPALTAVALALIRSGTSRIVSAGLAILLIGGIMASRTLTAALGLAAGVATLLLLVSWKRALAALLIVAGLGAGAAIVHPPIRMRVVRLTELARSGDYNALLTNRLTPFAAAAELARQHPLTGSGPGTFRWHYFDAKVAVEQRYPSLRGPVQQASWNYSFSEVHNDHLEVLSESGIPGYLLLLIALGWLGSQSWRGAGTRTPETVEAELALVLSLPLAVAFATLALAQFPLQTPAAAITYLFLAAACVAWRQQVPEYQPSRPPSRIWIPVAAVAAVVALALAERTVVRPLRCDVGLKQLETTTTRTLSARPWEAAPAARDTIERADVLLRQCPGNMELLMVRAVNLRVVNRRDEAIETYRRALAIEKRPEVLFQLGAALFESNRPGEAVDAFVEACRFQPLLMEQVPFAVRDEVISRLR